MEYVYAPFISLLYSARNSLLSHALGVAEDPVWCAGNDPPRRGKLSTNSHEVDIDVTSCLTTFVDAPTGLLAMDAE